MKLKLAVIEYAVRVSAAAGIMSIIYAGSVLHQYIVDTPALIIIVWGVFLLISYFLGMIFLQRMPGKKITVGYSVMLIFVWLCIADKNLGFLAPQLIATTVLSLFFLVEVMIPGESIFMRVAEMTSSRLLFVMAVVCAIAGSLAFSASVEGFVLFNVAEAGFFYLFLYKRFTPFWAKVVIAIHDNLY